MDASFLKNCGKYWQQRKNPRLHSDVRARVVVYLVQLRVGTQDWLWDRWVSQTSAMSFWLTANYDRRQPVGCV